MFLHKGVNPNAPLFLESAVQFVHIYLMSHAISCNSTVVQEQPAVYPSRKLIHVLSILHHKIVSDYCSKL